MSPPPVTPKAADGDITVCNDYVFIFCGGIPPFGLLGEMGVTFGGQTEAEKSIAAMPASTPKPAIIARPDLPSTSPTRQRASA